MALSRKSVRIFSAVEALREGQADIRYALLPIFAPDFAKFNGEIYDPTKISEQINLQYRLGITPDIIEQFTPIFAEKGWLAEISRAPALSYRVTLTLEDTQGPQDDFNKKANALGSEFREFVSSISPLIQIDTSEEALIDILVDWLVSLDIFLPEDLISIRRVESVGKKLIYTIDAPGDRAMSEEHYLAARFVSHLMKSNSEFVPFLVELGSVGLITEVVRDFQKPSDAVKKTDVIVYLDAPVALDFLGLSGRDAQDNIRTILSRVTNLGGTLRIFQLSVEELQNSLRALLSRTPSDRTGPTARALSNREVLEPFVRQMANSPDGILASTGIGIVQQDLQQFPNEHRFFPRPEIDELYSSIHWVDGDSARWHDAATAALIMRKRSGVRVGDLFSSKHVLITRNPFFGPKLRAFARAKAFLGPRDIGPVVHQREFATAVWLRAGLGISDQEIPRKYILSSCQRVLTVTKNVVSCVREVASSLTEPQKEQLELILSEGRATQVLMDKTLGSANIIDSTNVEMLVAEMKRSIGAEAYAEAGEIVRNVKSDSRKAVSGLKRQLTDAEQAVTQQNLKAHQAEVRLHAVHNSIVERSNTSNRRRRKIMLAIIVGAFILLQVAGILAGFLDGTESIIIATILAAVGTIIQFFEPLRRRLIDPRLERRDWRTLNSIGAGNGVLSISDQVEYSNGIFKLTTSNPQLIPLQLSEGQRTTDENVTRLDV